MLAAYGFAEGAWHCLQTFCLAFKVHLSDVKLTKHVKVAQKQCKNFATMHCLLNITALTN